MRRLMISTALLGTLALAGCAGGGGFGTVTPGGTGTATTDPTIAQVQDVAAKICGFVPTVSTVVSIITTFTGGGAIADMAGQAAKSICSAVTQRSVRRGMGPTTARGVKVEGYFLAK